MVANYLKRDPTKQKGLRVREFNLPQNPGLLIGDIDVMVLPEGHLCCSKCHQYKFEPWVYLDNHRINLGCLECGNEVRLLFPLDISLPGNTGRYACKRHPKKGFVVIHNIDVLSIGCELCRTEIQVKLRNTNNIILPN